MKHACNDNKRLYVAAGGSRKTICLVTAALLILSARGAIAGSESLTVTLTRKQIAANDKVYFNCDHEGKLGCLIAACRASKPTTNQASIIQYLYRDVVDDFPYLITRKLSACFVKAGGKIHRQ